MIYMFDEVTAYIHVLPLVVYTHLWNSVIVITIRMLFSLTKHISRCFAYESISIRNVSSPYIHNISAHSQICTQLIVIPDWQSFDKVNMVYTI